MDTATLLKRFTTGWYLADDGSVLRQDEVDASYWPTSYDAQGEPRFEPLRQRLVDHGCPTLICPRCSQPSWAISRHCVQVHGDTDVEIRPALPGKTRPEWFHPDWV